MLYENYGLNKNPFETDALQPNKDSLDKFVGRINEVKKFLATMSDPEGCSHVVSAKRGMGKTSFINVMQYICMSDNPKSYRIGKTPISVAPSRLVPCYQKLQIKPEDTIETFLFRVCTVLIQSARKYLLETNQSESQLLKELDDNFNKLILEEKEEKTNLNVLKLKIIEIINHLRSEYGRHGAFLVIDNVDIIDTQHLVNLLNQARMYLFELQYLYIVIVGDEGLYSSIASAKDGDRVTDILRGTETALEPFSDDNVITILNKRLEKGKMNDSASPLIPIQENVIKNIYKNCNGQIRLLFSVCDEIVLKILIEFPSLTQQITQKLVEDNINEIVKREVGWSNLSKRQKGILRTTLIKKGVRTKDYKELGFDRHYGVKNAMLPLLKSGHVFKSMGLPNDSRAVVYNVTGKVTLSQFCGLFDELEK